MKKKTNEKIINITKDKFKATSKLFWLIFSLVIVGVLTISGITIWLVLTHVNTTPSFQINLEQINGGIIRFDDELEVQSSKNFFPGSDLSVKITPNQGYYLTNLIIDDEIIEVENYGEDYKYNILNIDKDFKISAQFAVKDFVRMYVTQSENGTISPNSVSLNFGQNQTFTFTPNVGHKIESIVIDGQNITVTANEGESQTYTFEDVQTDHTIEVNYAIRTFWVNVTQPTNGNISPASVVKNYNTSQKFLIDSLTGYKLVELIIDGVAQPIENNNGERYEYNFIGIQTSHSISAKFEIRKFTVTFVGDNGEILSTQTVNFGSGATAPETVNPPEGHHFTGWDKTFNHIYNNTIILAQFEINRYEVIFLDWNDTQLYRDGYIAYGDDAEYNSWSLPTREGYRFDGWDGELTNITSNKIVKAKYVQQFKVNVTYNSPIGSENTITLLDINDTREFVFTPTQYFMIESISINGEVENIENTEFSEVLQNHKYLTGNSLTRTIENIQNDYNIIINLRIGPGIAESGWTYEIINEKYYITETPDLRALDIRNGNNIKWETIIPSKLYIENAIYDVYGIGNGNIRINFNSYNNLNTGIIVDDGIVAINNSAFSGFGDYYDAVKITSVILPDSILNIGQYAFYNCTNLTSIIISDNITSIESSAFSSCTSLISITIPEGVTNIAWNSFSGCTSLTSIIIPSGVTVMGEAAFRNCTNLTSVIFKEGSQINIIDSNTFSDCTSLTSITIPNSVTSIGGYAFYGCTSLASITIPSAVTNIGNMAFYGCRNLNNIQTDSTDKSTGTNGNGIYVINSNGVPVTTGGIAVIAVFETAQVLNFAGSAITTITISNDVTSIGDYAFKDCANLVSINSLGNVTSIGDYAFSGCTNLTSIVIPNSLIYIGNSAFSGCAGLTTITIPNSVSNIGIYSFRSCTSLLSVMFEETSVLTSIGEGAFSNCTSLITITIPSSVYNIESDVFVDCTSLSSIIVDSNNEYYSSLDGILFNKDQTTLLLYPSAKLGTSFIIPNSVISINNYAFLNCLNLTEIIFEEGSQLETIGQSAFKNCTSLQTMTIPSGVTKIENNTFKNCSSLILIIFEANTQLIEIEYEAFSGCSSLIAITIPNSVTNIGYSAFSGCLSLTSVIIPSGITIIESSVFKDCSNLTSIIIPSGIISIVDESFSGCNSLTSVIFEEDSQLNDIGNSAFSGCSNLSSIIIPDSVTNIAWNSFSGCLKLKVITIGKNVTDFNFAIANDIPALETIIIRSNSVLDLEIGYYFSRLTSIKEIYVPSQLVESYKSNSNWSSVMYYINEQSGPKEILYSDFIYPIITPEEFTYEISNTNELIITSINTTYTKYCIDSQYDIAIGEGTSTYYVNQIGNGVNCVDENASYVYLANGITTIADYAFIFSKLTTITIPNSVQTIGNHAFMASSDLENVVIEEGVDTIGNNAFYYCDSLETISIPSTIISIGDYAFYGCDNLVCLVIYATIPPTIGLEFIGDQTNNICVPKENISLYRDALAEYLVSLYTILTPDEFTYSIGYNYGNETPPAKAPYEIIITNINSTSGSYYIDSKYIINGILYYVKGVGKNATTPVDLNATSVVISKGIEYIQDYAFRGSNNLISATILSSRIGVGSFYDCHNLISITIGENVEKIGQAAFKKCGSLGFVKVLAINPPILSGSKEIFDIENNIYAIYVPSESVEIYKTAGGWSKYANKIMPLD